MITGHNLFEPNNIISLRLGFPVVVAAYVVSGPICKNQKPVRPFFKSAFHSLCESELEGRVQRPATSVSTAAGKDDRRAFQRLLSAVVFLLELLGR